MPHPPAPHRGLRIRAMAAVTATLFWLVPVGILVGLLRLAGLASGPQLFAAGALGAWGATRSGTHVTGVRAAQTALVGLAVLASFRPWSPWDWGWAVATLAVTGWATSDAVLGRVSWRRAFLRRETAS